jgi:NADH-quinone oxidoreductase subunit E
MSVRRLAPAEIQPKSFAFTADNENWAAGQIAKYPEGRQASAVIPLLWRAQEQEGWVTQAAIETIAAKLGMAKMRVLEVATFYTMFNLEPVGKYFVQLCGTTPCRLRGAEGIIDVCRERIGEQYRITPDGMFSWLEVECIGACCNAPVVQINQDYYEDLTPESFNKLLDDLAAGKPVKVGPQSERRGSEPAGAVKTLLDTALYDGSVVGAWRKSFDDRFEKAQAAKAEAARAKEAEAARSAQPAAPVSDKPAPVKQADASAKAEDKVAGHAPGRPQPSDGKSGAMQDTPAATGHSEAGKTPAISAGTDKEAKALAEESDIAARLATLPKDATPQQKADAVGTKPEALSAARGAKADDLKRIRGIGRVNEGKLNALGVFHFDQIGAWTRAEIRWVGTYLAFPGRIDRESWVEQAETLANGGETEFSRRVDDGDVPTSKS